MSFPVPAADGEVVQDMVDTLNDVAMQVVVGMSPDSYDGRPAKILDGAGAVADVLAATSPSPTPLGAAERWSAATWKDRYTEDVFPPRPTDASRWRRR